MKKITFLVLSMLSLNAASVVNSANDLCYEEPISTGGVMCSLTNSLSGGMCTSGRGCGIKIPLKNIGDLPLENVVVDYNESDIGGSWGDDCKANPDGTCEVKNNIDMGIFGIFGSATEFNFTDPISPTSNNVSAESSTFLSTKCFKLDKLYATYVKEGVVYRGKIRLCGTAPLPAGENNITAQCGVFSHMFQVRTPCSSGSGGHIDFDSAGQTLDGSNNIILDNSGNILNACMVNTPDWIKNKYETCGNKGDCSASGYAAGTLNIIYDNPPQFANVSTITNGSSSDVTIKSSNSVKNLFNNEYDEIKPDNGGVKDYTVNFHISNSLSVNTISTTVGSKFNFSSSAPYEIKIIDFKINKNGSGNTFVTDNNLKNLQIAHFEQASDTNVSIKATNSIKMNDFYVGRGSTVLLEAPYVNIDHFEPTNSGSGNTIIDIYADYIDINYTKLPQTTTLRIHPYTSGKKVLMRTNDINESSSSTILVSSGDYYINSDWVLPGTSDVSAIRAIDKNQKVNIFLNNGLAVGNNPGINSLGNDGNFGDNPPVNFKIFVNGDFNTGGGGTTINATLYAEGDVELGNPTYIRGAVNANNKITIGQGQFIFDQNITEEGWGSCGINNNKPIMGVFDAWDVWRNIHDRNISTKIVDKDFNLTLASLNNDNNATEEKDIGNIEVAIFDMNYSTQISNTVYFDTNSSSIVSKEFNVDVASKNARVGFKLCSDYNSTSKTHTLYSYDNCSGSIVDCDTAGLHFRRCFSSDNFAIRPDHFEIALLPAKLKAGESFDFNVSANAKEYNTSVNVDVNLTKNCSVKRADFNISSIIFSNGESNNTATFGDVGVVDINLTDKNWASVDDKDTPQTCDENGTYICLDQPVVVTIVPHHFAVNASYKNFKDSNFTYISNDLNMSSVLDINIIAQNKQNQITKNYNAQCYAKDVEINITKELNSPNVKNLIYIYKDASDTNSSVISQNINSDIQINYTEGNFTVDTNGSTTITLFVNFDKNYTTPMNSFDMNITDINVSDGNVTDKVLTFTNNNASFRYGRIEVQSVSGYGKDLNTTFKYSYWDNTKGWIVNEEHNVSSDDGTINLGNIKGFYTSNGDINMQLGDVIKGNEDVNISTTHSLPYSAKIHLSIPSWLWYHPLAKDYKDPSSSNPDCLTHPCLNSEFVNTSTGWGGISGINVEEFNATRRTSKIEESNNTTKSSKKGVSKLNW